MHGDDQVAILRRITTSFIRTQCLLDGFLVVGSRCRRTRKHVDKNALRFDRSGQLAQEATFGDGIESIGTTAHGSTWVGYFDEGVMATLDGAVRDRNPSAATGSTASMPHCNWLLTHPANSRSLTVTR